ncbi:type IV secretory system conjugative DNA transfer family protein [Lachnospiraceae bacterium YH-ros2228]
MAKFSMKSVFGFMKDPNPTDAPELRKESPLKEQEKTLRKEFFIVGIVMFLFTFLYSLHYTAAYVTLRLNGVDSPDMGQALSLGGQNLLTKFNYPFHCKAIQTVQGVKQLPVWNPAYQGYGGGPAALTGAVGFGILVLLIVFFVYTLQKPRLQNRKDSIKGNAKWGDTNKMETNMAEPFGEPGHIQFGSNYILSKNMYISYLSHDITNVNNLVVGEPGTGKSRGYVKPNLLQMNSSYIVTDPSGDIVKQMGETLYRFGYKVRIFDIATKNHTSTYNPMHYCRKEVDIKTLVDTFIANTDTSNGNSNADPFWDAAMNSYLCAIIGLLTKYGDNPLIMDGYVYKKDFPNLCEIARMTNERLDDKWANDKTYHDKEKTALGHIFNNLANHKEFWDDDGYGNKLDPYCLKKWRDFKTTPGKTADTILATTQVRLDAFNVQDIANITSTDSIDLDSFGTGRDVLFINIPVSNSSYNFLCSMLYSQMFDILYDRGEHKVQHTHHLKLQNGEEVKWYDQSWTDMDAIEKDVASIKNSHIEKVVVNQEVNDCFYEIIDDQGRVVSRRPDAELAEQYLSDLKHAKIVKQDGESVKNPTHIRMLLDEFANIGKIPSFPARLTTVRKYDISCDVIVQGVTQLKEMYKDTWETIDTGCYQTVFLGGKAKETVEWLSAKLGKTTKIGSSVSLDNKKISQNVQTEQADLMTPDQIGRLPNRMELVLSTGHNPVLDEKYNYPDHPYYKYTSDYAEDTKSGKMKFDYDRYPISRYVRQKYECPTPSHMITICDDSREGLHEFFRQFACEPEEVAGRVQGYGEGSPVIRSTRPEEFNDSPF